MVDFSLGVVGQKRMHCQKFKAEKSHDIEYDAWKGSSPPEGRISINWVY